MPKIHMQWNCGLRLSSLDATVAYAFVLCARSTVNTCSLSVTERTISLLMSVVSHQIMPHPIYAAFTLPGSLSLHVTSGPSFLTAKNQTVKKDGWRISLSSKVKPPGVKWSHCIKVQPTFPQNRLVQFIWLFRVSHVPLDYMDRVEFYELYWDQLLIWFDVFGHGHSFWHHTWLFVSLGCPPQTTVRRFSLYCVAGQDYILSPMVTISRNHQLSIEMNEINCVALLLNVACSVNAVVDGMIYNGIYCL